MPISEAKKRANKKWNEANKEKQRLYQYKSNAFIYVGIAEDIEVLKKLKSAISLRLKQLKEKEN